MEILIGLFLVVATATLGGIVSKLLKLPNLVGFIFSAIFIGNILPHEYKNITELSEVGTILLLFSVGLVLSFDTLSKYLKVALVGSIAQMILTSVAYFFVNKVFGFDFQTSLVFALGFCLSSTAVTVKILSDRGEMDTIHGQIMMGWLLIQDLAVIPMMIILPLLTNSSESFFIPLVLSLTKAGFVILFIVTIGKVIIPFIIHKISDTNSRELLLLTALTLAFGTAGVSSFFGISPALGAFLAGVVISEGQENHAIFAETRPLRDLFMAIFFVSLGFSIDLMVIVSYLPLITGLAILLVIIKFVITNLLVSILGYKGKTAVYAGVGLSSVSEFSFVIFTVSLSLKIIDSQSATIGIASSLLALVISSLLYKYSIIFWRKLKHIKFFANGEAKVNFDQILENHVIICGYGRVGKWIGKAFTELGIQFVVIEYDKSVVNELKKSGIKVFYGDPSEPEIMEIVNLKNAKMLILAIPDVAVQEALISYAQTHANNVKIISRVHTDSDYVKLKNFQINKLVQPEFEASMAILRSVLSASGRGREEIDKIVKGLRVSHS